jgi:hypothetical protein
MLTFSTNNTRASTKPQSTVTRESFNQKRGYPRKDTKRAPGGIVKAEGLGDGSLA